MALVLGVLACRAQGIAVPSGTVAGFVVEEYKVVSKDADTPDHYGFAGRIPPRVREKRARWRDVLRREEDRISLIRNALERLGYELAEWPGPEGPTMYSLRRKGKDVLPNITSLESFSTNERGDRFLLLVDCTTGTVLFRDGKVRKWDRFKILIPPILVGTSMMTVEQVGVGPGTKPHCSRYTYAVKRDGKTVYGFSVDEFNPADTIHRFTSHSGQWILEYDNNLVVNGTNVGRSNGYSKVFCFSFIKDKPFYFFEKDGKTRMSYDGRVLPNEYDEVIHYQCCEPANFNVRANDNMVWFYALRGGFWYYVEAGVFN